MSVRLAVFDCDGTLVDSQANIVAAMDECFRANGLAPPHATLTRRIVGLSLVEAMARLLPDAEASLHSRMADDYKTCFQRLRREEALAQEPLYDGTLASLTALAEAGWALAVATGKSDRGLDHTLDHHAIRGHFGSLQTADRHPSKPHPSMLERAMADLGAAREDTVMIGDTEFDMAMAVNAGVRALGVAWGYHDAETLSAAGAEIVFDDYAALTAHLLAR